MGWRASLGGLVSVPLESGAHFSHPPLGLAPQHPPEAPGLICPSSAFLMCSLCVLPLKCGVPPSAQGLEGVSLSQPEAWKGSLLPLPGAVGGGGWLGQGQDPAPGPRPLHRRAASPDDSPRAH